MQNNAALNTSLAPLPVASYTITLTRGRFYALLKSTAAFASKDTTRFHLNGVLLERHNAGDKFAALRAVATGGHTLARSDVPTTDFAFVGSPAAVPDHVLLSSEDVTALLGVLKCSRKLADDPVALSVAHSGKVLPTVTVTVGSSTIACRQIDAQFPAYEKVIPAASDDGTHTLGFNPEYMARACDAIAAFGRRADSNQGARITLGGSPLDPATITWSSPEDGEFTAIVMPMRLD